MSEHKPGLLEGLLLKLGTFGELLLLLVRGGRWWMLPAVVVLVSLGFILALMASSPWFAPFVYAVF